MDHQPPADHPNADTVAFITSILDHAILHPTVTDAAMRAEVRQIAPLGVASLCVRPSDVLEAVEAAEGKTAVGTVIGFPHGTTSTAAKVAEARQALRDGATELDMVVQVGAVLSGRWQTVQDDIAAVCAVAHENNALLKVIFETDYITRDQDKIRLCEICSRLAVDFVKTSTGFGYVKRPDGSIGYHGATEHDVKLMRQHCPSRVGIKPSGGIRCLADVLKFIALGATRIGTTSTMAIVQQARQQSEERSSHGTAPGAGHRQHEY